MGSQDSGDERRIPPALSGQTRGRQNGRWSKRKGRRECGRLRPLHQVLGRYDRLQQVSPLSVAKTTVRVAVTYAAVASLVGVLALGLMNGRRKSYAYSWVVAAASADDSKRG